MHEIYKGVPDVAFVFEIDWQVEEIVLTKMISIDIFQKHSLRILVWNIFYHYRGSDIFTFCDFMQINFKVNFFVIW